MLETATGLADRPRPLLDGDKLPESPAMSRAEPRTVPKTVYRKPWVFCRIIANYPNTAFGITLSVHMFFVLLSAGLMIGGYDLFPVEFETLPLHLYHQPWFKRELAVDGRWNFNGRTWRDYQQSPAAGAASRFSLYSKSLALLYDGDGANVLTPGALRAMRRIEDSLTTVPSYVHFCQQSEGETCRPAMSLLRFFDGTLELLDPVFNDPEFQNIPAVIHAAYTNPNTKDEAVQALGKGSVIEPDKLHVPLVRSVIPFGSSSNGLNDQEIEALLDFIEEHFQPQMNHYVEVEDAFSFMYYQEFLMIRDAKKQAYRDMSLALGSLAFIFLFIFFHTRSMWVTCLAVFSICCSFVETNLVYRVLLDFRYFGFFHVLAIFIILGIGADDLFVFWDAWKAAELRRFPSLALRLDATYRRSVISMLVTSLTTMLAFLTSVSSPMLATKAFGLFSAILVMLDYISIITFFPTIVLFHHLHFENKPCCCCCCCCSRYCGARSTSATTAGCWPCRSRRDDRRELAAFDTSVVAAVPDIRTELRDANANTSAAGQAAETAAEKQLRKDEAGLREVSDCGVAEPMTLLINSAAAAEAKNEAELRPVLDFTDRNNSTALLLQADPNHPAYIVDALESKDPEQAQPELRWLVRFFRDHYFWLVTHRVYRWLVLVPAFALMIGMALSASSLEPDNKQIGLFRESHQYTRAFRRMSSGFLANWNDYAVMLRLVWGLKEQDMSICHFSDYKCLGRTVFDDTFNPNTRAAQLSFVNLCDTLYNFTDQEIEDFAIKRDNKNQVPMIFCFTKPLNEFLKRDPFLASLGVAEGLPWERPQIDKFAELVMTRIDQVSAASALLNQSFTHYLDVPVNYYIWGGYMEDWLNVSRTRDAFVGEEETEFSRSINISSKPGVVIGNKVKWIETLIGLNLKYETMSYRQHLPVVERWESFMRQQLSLMPPEMQSGFQSCQVAWHMLYIQQALVINAVSGILLSLCVSLPILVVATSSIVNGLLAMLTICGVTACVLGVIPLAGWKLGVLVSLNMCLVVGLAVDYVVHLAEGYHMSKARDRKGRVRHALETMGSSVFSGACTTLGASVFLVFSRIQFFYQFGLFMFCTIGFSLVFSLALYIPLMGIMGPKEDFDIRIPLRACSRRLAKWKLFNRFIFLRSVYTSSPEKDGTFMDPSGYTPTNDFKATFSAFDEKTGDCT